MFTVTIRQSTVTFTILVCASTTVQAFVRARQIIASNYPGFTVTHISA